MKATSPAAYRDALLVSYTPRRWRHVIVVTVWLVFHSFRCSASERNSGMLCVLPTLPASQAYLVHLPFPIFFSIVIKRTARVTGILSDLAVSCSCDFPTHASFVPDFPKCPMRGVSEPSTWLFDSKSVDYSAERTAV
jgi:hypothetical protein